MDWKQLIAEISAAGATQASIARHAGVTQGYISELANGKATDPRYSVAEKLKALHRKSRKPSKTEA